MGGIQPQTVELSVAMPCLNEAETLATCIRKARRPSNGWADLAKSSWPTTAVWTGSQAIAAKRGAPVVTSWREEAMAAR